MEDKPAPTKTRSRTWIIIAVVVALLFTCIVSGLVGAAAGYVVGRSAARAQSTPPQEYRLEPTPERSVPIPEMPGMPSGWALVIDVTEDSPADRAGLRVGDLIVSVGGESLSDEVSLTDLIQQYEPGDAVELVVWRGGRERSITVTLGRRPEGGDAPWMGLTYRQVSGGPGTRFGVPRTGDQLIPFSGGSQ